MKKAISLLLALVMIVSLTAPAFAATTDEEYYVIPIEYSDNIGHLEQLKVMIQDSHVFADAKTLAGRLGYSYSENDDGITIFNKDTSNKRPYGITLFKFNSTQVSHMLFNKMIGTYEAPFASIKNSEGAWIPLEYSLLMINSAMMITDKAILIDVPQKGIIDYFYDIARNSAKYNFDWADDIGYTDTEIKILGANSHLINLFSGILGRDSDSWAAFFQQFIGSAASYDKKYGEDLAMLLCTESNKELQSTIDKVSRFTDIVKEDGTLGKILTNTSKNLDSDVGRLYKDCEDILQKVKSGNSPLLSYNRSYQALEKAMDKEMWFSKTGGTILEVQKGISDAAGSAFTMLDIGKTVLEAVGYTQEFQKQDDFSLAALTYYLDNADNGLELPRAMKQSMIDYADILSSNIAEYTVSRYRENLDQWIIDQIPLEKTLGTQAAAVLLAWDIASKTIPFISNGLSGADSFELAVYSMVFQGDAFLNYTNKRDYIFNAADSVTASDLYDLSQYCYMYLKTCYATRESALASLASKSDSTKEVAKPLIEYQNSINAEIADIMVALKGANETNDGGVFGFLPADNKTYLKEYDDNVLLQWVKGTGLENNGNIGEQIKNAIAEAAEFTWNWFYLNKYADHTQQIKADGERFDTFELIDYPNVHSLDDLRSLAKQYYTDSVIEALISSPYKEWVEKNGNLYVSPVSGIGGESIDYKEIAVKLNADHYQLEIMGIKESTIIDISSCAVFLESGKYIFDKAFVNCSVDQSVIVTELNSIPLYDGSNIAISGILTEKEYEINQNNSGHAYILELDFPINVSLFSDIAGYSGEDEVISEIQLSFYSDSPYIRDTYVGNHVSVNGQIMYGHTAHHVTTIVITYANAELLSHENTISEDEAYKIACDYWNYTPGTKSPETGFELYLVSDGLTDSGKDQYYAFRLRWYVQDSSGGHMSTVDSLYVNTQTGECTLSI